VPRLCFAIPDNPAIKRAPVDFVLNFRLCIPCCIPEQIFAAKSSQRQPEVKVEKTLCLLSESALALRGKTRQKVRFPIKSQLLYQLSYRGNSLKINASQRRQFHPVP